MQKRVIAYLADWGFHEDITYAQAALLTHVNYSFGLIVNGEISTAHLEQLERLRRLRKQHPSLKVNLSIGGWGAGGFSEAVATEEAREKLALSALKTARELNLDGLDWDWEYPASDVAGISASPDDIKNMTAFLVLMREKLCGLEKELGHPLEQSIAVGADRTGDYLWPKALPALNTVNLMTYDMSMEGCAGHVTNLYPSENASYSAADSVRDFARAGVPKEKLLIGAAFYFHAWEGCALPDPLGKPYAKRGRNFGHDQLDASWEYRWDSEARAAFYLMDDKVLSGDDEQSLEEKKRFIQKQGLGGVIIWELNHDRKNLLLPHLV